MNKPETPETAREKADNTRVYFAISLSGFTLLWLAAMPYISLFDAVVIFCIICCAGIGTIRGGVQEFFSFFGVLASLLIAVHAYQALHAVTGFNFGTDDPFWGKLGWFLISLAGGWLVCRFLSRYLEKSMKDIGFLQYANRIFGGTVGGVKGLILGYVFIIVVMGTEVSHQAKSLEEHFQYSYAHHQVADMEERYHFLEKLEKIEFPERVQRMLSRFNPQ